MMVSSIHLYANLEISVALMEGLPCQHAGELAVNCEGFKWLS